MSEKEGNKETFEFLRAATNYLSDRFLQPLSASLLLSWVAWNYKIIVILISFDSVDVKFKNIDLVQSGAGLSMMGYSLSSYWTHGFILPLVSALAFIYLYPFFSTHALKRTLMKQRAENELKRQNSEEELIDVTRSRELVKENAQLKLAVEDIKQFADEKEKSLTETINILESNIIRLNEQLVANQKSSSDEVVNVHLQKNAEDIFASSINESANSIEPEPEPEPEPDNLVLFGAANVDKIRKSNFIWPRLKDRIDLFEPGMEFQVSQLFDSSVWNDYNSAQKAAIASIFDDRYRNNEYINIRYKGVDQDSGLAIYVSIPFLEYYGWQEIKDKVMAFIGSKAHPVMLTDIYEKLGLRPAIVKNCLAYLLEKGYVKKGGRSINGAKVDLYNISSAGRLYAEALDY